MPVLGIAFLGVAVPAVVAAALFLSGKRLPLLSSGAIGVGLAYFSGHLLLFGWPGFPPLDSSDWSAWLGLLCAACGIAQTQARRHPRASRVALLVGPCTVPWLLLPAGQAPGIGAMITISVAASALALSVEALARRRPGASMPLVLWAGASGASAVLLLSGSVKLAQMAGIAAAAMGAAFVLGWCRLLRPLAAGAPAAVTALLGAAILNGCIYDVPIASGLLVLAAPSAAWIGELGAVARWPAWKGALARFGLTLVLAGAAVALAWHASPSFE